MAEKQPTQEEVARHLAAFLTTRSGYANQGRSPLEEMLQAQITHMTREIAADFIAETPELRDYIKRMVEGTVRWAMQKDGWLNQTVVSAVAKALTDLALERPNKEVE